MESLVKSADRYTTVMDAVTLFGVVSVTAMLVFYALEQRAPAYILLFAFACVLSSAYGFLQGAWPFGIVEAVWSVVAWQRWRSRIRPSDERALQSAVPIACDMSAFTPAERRSYHELRGAIAAAVGESVTVSSGLLTRGHKPRSRQAHWQVPASDQSDSRPHLCSRTFSSDPDDSLAGGASHTEVPEIWSGVSLASSLKSQLIATGEH